MSAEDENVVAAIKRRLTDAVVRLPKELASIIGQYAQERPHRWRPIDDQRIKIDGTVLTVCSYSGKQIESTESTVTGPNRWRIQFEFDAEQLGWICTGATGAIAGIYATRLTIDKYACPAMSEFGRRFIEINRGGKSTDAEYKQTVCQRGRLDFDLTGSYLTISDPDDLPFRMRLLLSVTIEDWRPCVIVGGSVTATILPLP